MFKIALLVFVGGAIGAMGREFLMLGVPDLHDGFPMPIFVANIVAALLLGLVTGLTNKGRVNSDVNTLIATGMMGGLSTFSSFVYGSYVLMSGSVAGAFVALAYLLISIVGGYVALLAGLKAGSYQASPSRLPKSD